MVDRKIAASVPEIARRSPEVLDQNNGKKRFVDAVLKLTKANALCGTLDEAIELEAEIAFYQAVKAALVKGVQQNGKTQQARSRR